MSTDPADRMDVDDAPPSDRGEEASASDEGDSEPEAPELMVVSRARRSNAGNRMSTLLAKAVEEEPEQWGEEWEEAPNEEEFVGDDANDQDDFNMDSSESEEGDDDGRDDDAGEKELRKAERQERNKKRKTATNPFTARLAVASRKKVKLNVPPTESTAPAPRPKKKSERASWIPTEEDGPIRTSKRKQTVANKESTLAKLKEKDKRRDDTLAMMKAAEARKAKHEPKPMTQAERLAEAARVERKNSKSLHRWEEAEEQRAADRQAKLDALKNRQIGGPFIRYYSGPCIWVDEKLKYTGKDAPKIEELEEKLNKDPPLQPPQSGNVENPLTPQDDLLKHHPGTVNQPHTSQNPSQDPSLFQSQPPLSQTLQTPQSSWQPDQPGQAGYHGAPHSNNTMFAPSQTNTFLSGIEQYADHSQMHPPIPHNPWADHPALDFQPIQSPFSHSPFSHSPFSAPHPLHSDPILSHNPPSHESLLAAFQRPSQPTVPAPPPRKKVIMRALRNLLILTSFPNLDDHAPSRPGRNNSALKDKDRASLVSLCSALFSWSASDSLLFVNAMLDKKASRLQREKEIVGVPALRVKKELCAVSNQVARYRDPGTGIAYRDARAYGILRGVVGGGFMWSGSLGCYVGARPGKGNGEQRSQPAVGVPKRFLEIPKAVPLPVPVPVMESLGESSASVTGAGPGPVGDVKMEEVSAPS